MRSRSLPTGEAPEDEDLSPPQPDRRPRPADRSWLTVAAAAAELGLSEMTLYRAIADGDFPAVRIRNRLIVPRQALLAMADAAMSAGGEVAAASVVTAKWDERLR